MPINVDKTKDIKPIISPSHTKIRNTSRVLAPNALKIPICLRLDETLIDRNTYKILIKPRYIPKKRISALLKDKYPCKSCVNNSIFCWP